LESLWKFNKKNKTYMPGIADLRKDYTLSSLERDALHENPLIQFKNWFADALDVQQKLHDAFFEPNAMTLATATKDGKPSARTVLLKGVDERGFIFFTNYESRKAKELVGNPYAALCFHWEVLERQVCITGSVEKISSAESEAYFTSRPVGSQIGAWASAQSTVIESREMLLKKISALQIKYPEGALPLPPFWGGYCVVPTEIEFWQGQSSRLHDRFRYRKDARGVWIVERLSP
jgi:pyridoxamine 5'-phosphate oxidase